MNAQRWMGAKVTSLPLPTRFGSIGGEQLGEVYALLKNQQYVYVRWTNGWQSVERTDQLNISNYEEV